MSTTGMPPEVVLETLEAVGRRLHEATREPHHDPALLVDRGRLMRLVDDLAGERDRRAVSYDRLLARNVELADERDAARRDGAADALDWAAREWDRTAVGINEWPTRDQLHEWAAEFRAGTRAIPTTGQEEAG